MRTGRYSISELFGNRHVEQLVIPEIQRDYVWMPVQVQGLVQSILRNFTLWHQDVYPQITLDFRYGAPPNLELETLQKDFLDFYSRRTHATNVGFIYAYCDADLPGQHFLIDGQQRLTTIYLMLLAVAASHEDLKNRFRVRYQFGRGDNLSNSPTSTRLDYRLREHTANFLHRMVSFLLENGGAADALKNQAWYLEEAERDTTTRNLMQNYQEIQKLLNEVLTDSQQKFRFNEYLEDLVDCWYFDTNESAQGEELYLYLNARGEAIADNENQKANLLKGLSSQEKKAWGAKWEAWQDVFWNHRRIGLKNRENPTADRGFNSFLSSHDELSKLRGAQCSTSLEKLESIEFHVEILLWLERQKDDFKSLYSYADWIDDWFRDLWEAFNDPVLTDWEILSGKDVKKRDQNRQTLAWGSLLCVLTAWEAASQTLAQVEPTQLFRAIRVFYLQSYSGSRSPKSLPKLAGIVFFENETEAKNEDGLDETSLKWHYLKKFGEQERREVECVIWKIEDHELNLKADDLGGLNLTHLVDLKDQNLNLVALTRRRDEFYNLFPVKETYVHQAEKKKLALVLITYGAFWDHVSPWYYHNFNFGNWKKTIRGLGNAEKPSATQKVFRRFFDEFVTSGESLDVFFNRKLKETLSIEIDPATETDFRHAILWYGRQMKEDLFSYGLHITSGSTWDESTDAHFTALRKLWNTSGNFRGGYLPLSRSLQNLEK